MAGALVFLVGQLFLIGTTSAQCPVPCTPCKEFTGGSYAGTWSLTEENDPRCPDSCLYQHSDGGEMCFCDPGQTAYGPCCENGEIKVQIFNELPVYANGSVFFAKTNGCPYTSLPYGPSANGSNNTFIRFPCECYINKVTAAPSAVGSTPCTPWKTFILPGTQFGPFTIRENPILPDCQVTKP